MNKAKRDTNDYKSRYRLISLLPKQFLDLAKPLEQARKSSYETVDSLLESETKFESLVTLKTNHVAGNVFQVIGHDGRHRCLRIQRKYPNKTLPVYISDSSVRWMEDKYDGKPIVLISEDKRTRIKVSL
ncbi:MAG: hypothetical protein ACRC6V_03405 [Bacteroidales bacterium]